MEKGRLMLTKQKFILVDIIKTEIAIGKGTLGNWNGFSTLQLLPASFLFGVLIFVNLEQARVIFKEKTLIEK